MSVHRLSASALLFLGGTCIVPAQADPRIDVLSAAGRCNAIADYRSWLDCYYGAAQPMRVQLGLPPAPASQLALVPPATAQTPAPQAAYQGPVTAPPGRTAVPRSQSAMGSSLGGDDDYVPKQRIAAYSFDTAGWFSVTFADGQTWKQVEQDSIYAHWRGPADSYYASVVPGMVGSHLLRMSDGHSYRVSRVSGAAKH
jgi:hypothetical protein